MNKTQKRLQLCSETLHRLERRELASVGGAATSNPPMFIGGCNSVTCATCVNCGGGGTATCVTHSATQFICTN
jgi:hypothetical protein